MSVLQYPVSKRPAVLLIFAVLALVALCVASRASAESSVYSHPQTNVFFRYGVGPVSPSEGYTNMTQVYNGTTFVNTKSSKFGGLSVHKEKVSLKLAADETIVQIETDYKLSTGDQIHIKWNGKGSLAIHRRIGSTEATLVVVAVGVHSPKLPDQPEEPKYSGMH
jgi:hypothetical protein